MIKDEAWMRIDWAVKAADVLFDDFQCAPIHGTETDRLKVATALRKAKADGMREAAELMDSEMFENSRHGIRSQADKIERGEA